MISKSAVRAFLNRQLRDMHALKALPPAEVDRRLAALDPPPVFHTVPRHHQKICFLLGTKYNYLLPILDMGVGKTKVMLDLIAWRKARGEVRRALVLVPGVANVPAWADEVRIHRPDLSVSAICMTGTARRQQAFEADVDVVVITYAGYLRMVCQDRPPRCAKKHTWKTGDRCPKVLANGKICGRKNESEGWVVDKKKLDAVAASFDMAVFDECTQLQTASSLPFKACDRLTDTVPLRYGLTGMPIGDDPEAFWAQFYVLDKGETLGETLGLFRAAFCSERMNPFKRWPDYVFDKTKAGELHRVTRNRAIRYEESECNDLPPFVRITRPVEFTQETWQYYEKLVADLSSAHGNFKILDNVFHSMRYLVAGYLVVTDPEGARTVVRFKKNPKLDAVVEAIRELPQERKFLIFCHYKLTGELIGDRLDAEKIRATRLYSGTKDKPGTMARFKTDPKVRGMICSSAGAMGLNLQEANYEFFYETPTDPRIRKQMEKRAHRTGQTRRVFCVDFPVKNSVDMKILRALAKGEDMRDEIINGRARIN